MSIRNQTTIRVLAIDPSSAGFGFVVLEDPTRLVDWGVAEVWSRSARAFLARVESLVDRYKPNLVVLEEVAAIKQRKRTIRLISSVVSYAATRHITVVKVSRSQVRAAFGGEPTKHDIAVSIATVFPELVPRLPPKRKLWTSEKERMNIFDALSFALTALAMVPPVDGAAE
jgi:Holliday junction resolvasome RuvABC endonuclease subunit